MHLENQVLYLKQHCGGTVVKVLCCATNKKIAGSIADGVIVMFH